MVHIKRIDEMFSANEEHQDLDKSPLFETLDSLFDGKLYICITNEDAIGKEYGIKKLEMSKDGRDGDTVCICINRIEMAERNTGAGSKLMEKICMWADLNKVTLTLTPSTDFGATSESRLTSFYKRFGFVPNKGRHTVFATRESMFRKPR